MIRQVSHTPIYVLDTDRALAFYTEKLGFEVRMDLSMDGFRWLTVGPKDQPTFQFLLTTPQPPMFTEPDAEAVRQMVAKGAFSGGVLETDDCRGDFERLRAAGVTFLQEPSERPYGIEAVLRDDSGNWFSLTQRR